MTRPKPPEGDDLADLAHVLPPEPAEPPSTYTKRWPCWTMDGLVGSADMSPDDAARYDDAIQDRWAAEAAAEEAAREERREQSRARAERQADEHRWREQEAAARAAKAERDATEQRLRIAARAARLRRQQGGA